MADHPGQWLELLDRTLLPEPFASAHPLTGALLAAVAVATALALALGRAGRRGGGAGSGRGANAWRGVLLGAVWLELFFLTYAARGVWRLWYVLPLAAGLALVLAGVAQRLADAWRARAERPLAGRVAGVGLGALALSLLWQGRFGVVLGDLHPVRERTRRIEAFYGELERRIEQGGPGVAIEVPRAPVQESRPLWAPATTTTWPTSRRPPCARGRHSLCPESACA